MTDLPTRLTHLRAKLVNEDDPEERAELEAAIAALEEKLAARPPLAQSISGAAQVGVAIAGNLMGNLSLDGRRSDQAQRLLHDYLRQICVRCGSVPLQALVQ